MDKIKVLIAEDERTTRAIYDKGLFNEIFDKKMVISGKDALLAYKEWRPDIVVLDIYIPEMTGYQVLKEIRTDLKDLETTIVMATSMRGTEDVLSCLRLGIEGYIVKPFKRTEIALKLLSYYAKKEPERAQLTTALYHEIERHSLAKLPVENNEPEGMTSGEPEHEAGDGQTEKPPDQQPA